MHEACSVDDGSPVCGIGVGERDPKGPRTAVKSVVRRNLKRGGSFSIERKVSTDGLSQVKFMYLGRLLGPSSKYSSLISNTLSVP